MKNHGNKTITQTFCKLVFNIILLIRRLRHLDSDLRRRIHVPLKVDSKANVVTVACKLPEYTAAIHVSWHTNLHPTEHPILIIIRNIIHYKEWLELDWCSGNSIGHINKVLLPPNNVLSVVWRPILLAFNFNISKFDFYSNSYRLLLHLAIPAHSRADNE